MKNIFLKPLKDFMGVISWEKKWLPMFYWRLSEYYNLYNFVNLSSTITTNAWCNCYFVSILSIGKYAMLIMLLIYCQTLSNF